MRIKLILIFGAMLFGIYAILDQPTREERALATQVAEYIANKYGNLPLHSNSNPAVGGKTYSVRPAHNGSVVFATYGLTSTDEMARLRSVTKQVFTEVAELQAVSLEFYEANVIMGKARFISRVTVLR
jgi:hypothetical protein